jgi:hypothetical protein
MITHRTIVSKKIATLMAAMLGALVLAAVGVSPLAHAADSAGAHGPSSLRSSIACLGSANVTYTPGMTNTPAQVSGNVDYEYTHCRVVNQPGVTSGGFKWIKSEMESCADLSLGGPAFTYPMYIVWNDNTTTVATVTVSRDPAITMAVAFKLTGVVNSGHFAGDTARIEIVFLNVSPNLAECNSPAGLTSLSGVIALSLRAPRHRTSS